MQYSYQVMIDESIAIGKKNSERAMQLIFFLLQFVRLDSKNQVRRVLQIFVIQEPLINCRLL